MPIECGGIDSTIPLVVGALTGLPVVDADGMGRVFPELQMETFSVLGVSGSPMVVTNEYGDSAMINARDEKFMEWIARGVTIRMGGAAYIAEYSMSGGDVKRTAVPNTISLGIQIGRCLREAKADHKNPIEALLEMLPRTLYSFAKVIWRGKVVDVRRETKMGWALGYAKIEGFDGWNGVMEIQIQNENFIARVDGKVRAIVPDLICIMEAETAEPPPPSICAAASGSSWSRSLFPRSCAHLRRWKCSAPRAFASTSRTRQSNKSHSSLASRRNRSVVHARFCTDASGESGTRGRGAEHDQDRHRRRRDQYRRGGHGG